jgi:hypothetical protein
MIEGNELIAALGRWELGDTGTVATDGGPAIIPISVADPECEGKMELDLLPGAFGTDFSARYMDREIRTPGERTAVQLVERSGIVIPSCKIPGNSDDGGTTESAKPLHDALIAQLLLQEQVQNNLPSPPPATALTNVLATVAESDLIFGAPGEAWVRRTSCRGQD